ncbi:MAG: hypothetical protein II838_07630 [Lachnospiraceae bacterium]|nr:hypothetical protein [Lachnospiraceae bacterium]
MFVTINLVLFSFYTIDERELFVEEVIVEKLSERIEVYNLEIDGLHTYYAGCVLVHNECKSGVILLSILDYRYFRKSNYIIKYTLDYIDVHAL